MERFFVHWAQKRPKMRPMDGFCCHWAHRGVQGGEKEAVRKKCARSERDVDRGKGEVKENSYFWGSYKPDRIL